MGKNEIINRIITIAANKYPDSEIYLYGSQARGDAKKSSDWDILILLNMDKINFETETKLMDDYYDLELETGELISPMVYSKSEWYSKYIYTPLFENIKKEGIKLK